MESGPDYPLCVCRVLGKELKLLTVYGRKDSGSKMPLPTPLLLLRRRFLFIDETCFYCRVDPLVLLMMNVFLCVSDVTVHSSSAVHLATVTSPPPTARLTLSLHVSVPTSPDSDASATAAATAATTVIGCHGDAGSERTFRLHCVTTRTSYIGPYSPV